MNGENAKDSAFQNCIKTKQSVIKIFATGGVRVHHQRKY